MKQLSQIEGLNIQTEKTGPNIFIVEDNELYSFMLKYKLNEEENYNIISFASGGEIIKYQKETPDMIILDYHLPDQNGYDLFKSLKKTYTKTPFIILTADRSKNIKDTFKNEDILSFIEKGDHVIDKLVSTIREYYANKKISIWEKFLSFIS